jgi:hypothetical protein
MGGDRIDVCPRHDIALGNDKRWGSENEVILCNDPVRSLGSLPEKEQATRS